MITSPRILARIRNKLLKALSIVSGTFLLSSIHLTNGYWKSVCYVSCPFLGKRCLAPLQAGKPKLLALSLVILSLSVTDCISHLLTTSILPPRVWTITSLTWSWQQPPTRSPASVLWLPWLEKRPRFFWWLTGLMWPAGSAFPFLTKSPIFLALTPVQLPGSTCCALGLNALAPDVHMANPHLFQGIGKSHLLSEATLTTLLQPDTCPTLLVLIPPCSF